MSSGLFSHETRQLLQRSCCLPSRMGCKGSERDVMEDFVQAQIQWCEHVCIGLCVVFLTLCSDGGSLVIVRCALSGKAALDTPLGVVNVP